MTGPKSAQQNGEQTTDLVAWTAACFGVGMDTEEKRSRFGEIDHPRLPLPIMWSRRQEIRRTSFYASVLARALRRSVSRFTVQRSGGSIDYDYALLMESEQGLYSAARLCSITDYPDIRTSACVLSVCVCVRVCYANALIGRAVMPYTLLGLFNGKR